MVNHTLINLYVAVILRRIKKMVRPSILMLIALLSDCNQELDGTCMAHSLGNSLLIQTIYGSEINWILS